MGLIEKQVSKSKTKPETIVVPAASPYCQRNNVRLLLFAVATELAGARTRSSARRGRVGIFASTSPSTVWCETDPLAIVLGARDGSGARATDWRIRLSTQELGDGSRQITIETPEYLMNDGSLVNSSAYKKTRARIREGLVGGRLPSGGLGQAEFSADIEAARQLSLAVELPESLPFERNCSIFSSVPLKQLDERLERALLRPAGTSGPLTIALGVGSDAGSTLEYEPAAVPTGSRICLRLRLVSERTNAETAASLNHARDIVGDIRRGLRDYDPREDGDWTWMS